MSCVTESLQLQSALPMKCLLIAGEKLNIILMCFVQLIAPILRCTEHTRNLMKFSVWKCIDFSRTLYGWIDIQCFISLSFNTGYSVYLWIAFWFIIIVTKYLGIATVSKDLLPITRSLLCPELWCLNTNTYLVFSVFTSMQTFLLACKKSFCVFVLYLHFSQINIIIIIIIIFYFFRDSVSFLL